MDVRAGVHAASALYPWDMPVGLIWSLNANLSDVDRHMGTGMQPVGQSCTPTGFQIVTIAGKEYEEGIPFYLYGKENYVHVRGDDGNLLDVEFAEITFHYDAPPKVEFDLSDSASEAERKVLIHKFRDEDTYPSSAQQRLASTAEGADRRIEIKATALIDGVPASDKTIYLRLHDPADPSPYVPAAKRVPGDNREAGRFEKIAPDGTLQLVPETSAVSDSSGIVRVVLRVTNRNAGDNYQVEASAVQGFGNTTNCTTTNNCYRSGIITAWKRVYLESDVMFRRGAFVESTSGPAAAPSQPPNIVYVDSCKPFKAGQSLYLIHGPRTDGLGGAGYYGEPAVLVAKSNKGGQCALELNAQLANSYFGPDGSRSYLADAVGIVGTGDDFYEADSSLLRDEFAHAYVDYVVLPVKKTFDPLAKADPLSIVPHLPEVGPGDAGASDEIEHRVFAMKWFYEQKPNHQHLIAATIDGVSKDRYGLAYADNDQNYTYVFVKKIDGKFFKNPNLNREVTVHEIVHLWHVNPGGAFGGGVNGEHCSHRNWQNAGTCTGFYALDLFVRPDGNTDDCGGVCAEYQDGRVQYHLKDLETDSEYTYIRRRPDPVPHQKGVTN
jgi:hypothetical protein